jgi:hypothetical protein
LRGFTQRNDYVAGTNDCGRNLDKFKERRGMKEIKLTQGYVALVDDDIFPILNQVSWHAHVYKKAGCVYAHRAVPSRSGGQTKERLHHYVIGKPLRGFVVDHINGNPLDNRRDNLRLATHRENMQNQCRHRNGKLVGTTYLPWSGKWRARIVIRNKYVSLGCYDTETEAHLRYKAAVESLNQ